MFMCVYWRFSRACCFTGYTRFPTWSRVQARGIQAILLGRNATREVLKMRHCRDSMNKDRSGELRQKPTSCDVEESQLLSRSCAWNTAVSKERVEPPATGPDRVTSAWYCRKFRKTLKW